MSVSALMSIGLRAMIANYAALQTSGHNIANANVEGFSRQQAELATSTGQFSGAGFFGKGVDVVSVTRVHNEYLTRESAASRSIAAMDAARLSMLQRLEGALRPGEQGVGHATGQLLNAFVDVASRPSDSAARQVALARAGDVADRFAVAGADLDTVQAAVTEELKAAVETVNQLAGSIAQVNQKIAALRGLGQPANDLLDERDRLVARLSDQVQVSTIAADDGTLGVFIAGGQRLVLGNQISKLAVVADESDPSRSAVAIDDVGRWRSVDEAFLGGGAITGLLKFQNNDLVRGFTGLGQLAATLAGVINNQQSLGLDLRDPPGAGAPLFDVGALTVRHAASNERNPGGQFAADVTLTVSDATQLQASEYDLRAAPGGPAGTWQLTRLADGMVRNVVDGDVVDGFQLSLGTPAPATNDRFVLQPVSRAAVNLRRVLDDPRGLAAALPVSATVSPSNTGTGMVAALSVVSTALDPDLNASVNFTNGSGAYAWELRNRNSNALVASGTGNWTPGVPVAMNGFELQLSGAPRAGDVFNVGRTTFATQNNGNALAFVALRDAAIVGREPLSTGGLGGGATLTDTYASVLSGIGVAVQGAGTAAQISASVSRQAEASRTSFAGVNLDEEAARLLQQQQGYQAAARVLQVAQSIFDTLLDAAQAR